MFGEYDCLPEVAEVEMKNDLKVWTTKTNSWNMSRWLVVAFSLNVNPLVGK